MTLLADAIGAIDPVNGERALDDMLAAGATVHAWGRGRYVARSRALARTPPP